MAVGVFWCFFFVWGGGGGGGWEGHLGLLGGVGVLGSWGFGRFGCFSGVGVWSLGVLGPVSVEVWGFGGFVLYSMRSLGFSTQKKPLPFDSISRLKSFWM